MTRNESYRIKFCFRSAVKTVESFKCYKVSNLHVYLGHFSVVPLTNDTVTDPRVDENRVDFLVHITSKDVSHHVHCVVNSMLSQTVMLVVDAGHEDQVSGVYVWLDLRPY